MGFVTIDIGEEYDELRCDARGMLRVGPQSAGSEPGPACYGRGGANPTVTDADVVLGYIDPARFLGGDMTLDNVSVVSGEPVTITAFTLTGPNA